MMIFTKKLAKFSGVVLLFLFIAWLLRIPLDVSLVLIITSCVSVFWVIAWLLRKIEQWNHKISTFLDTVLYSSAMAVCFLKGSYYWFLFFMAMNIFIMIEELWFNDDLEVRVKVILEEELHRAVKENEENSV